MPGIGITDDPLLRDRSFSYLDTRLTRLGGPNFAQIPINRPIAPVRSRQQDGSTGIRSRDRYSQATLFWNSMSSRERRRVVAAYRFEHGPAGRHRSRGSRPGGRDPRPQFPGISTGPCRCSGLKRRRMYSDSCLDCARSG